MFEAKEYGYHVFWDESDQVFIATVVEFPSLSHADDSQSAALQGIVDLVDFALEDIKEAGEEPPVPIMRRKFSGKVSLRMTPEQHRRVAFEAAEQEVSINQLLVSRI